MNPYSSRFDTLSLSQQDLANKRKQFMDSYLLETPATRFLHPDDWDVFCERHCEMVGIAQPKREEFAKWCLDFKIWQGDLFVLSAVYQDIQQNELMQ
ncbi:hypothetical protein [Vibrio gallicus]|uniref:hypothetical protein n=1 Tax=Vibrio gallicus TaxID=190897 RepID=UPI0021C3DBE9|nr:hypothetical protein [Vibrio gallicus]